MAFLDNSGDIILDAVLTETGRRKMALGDFRIIKFALGDDEIDYTLYNKNHPSGSAYFDLEILQTPVFEAFTQINAGINYGLLPTTALDLLYLPIMKVNELTAMSLNNIAANGGIYYITDISGDTGTTDSTSITAALASASVGYIQGTTTSTNNYVLFETGLDTGFGQLPTGTEANKESYLSNNNLVDSNFYVYYDSRFFGACSGPSTESTFTNNGTGNTFNGSISLISAASINLSIGLESYSAVRVEGISNQIYWSSTSNNEESYSVIGGPRASVSAVSPVIKVGLSAEYTLYGTTNSTTLFDGSTSFNYIDTTIYAQGTLSSAQIQIPVRIIRLS